MTNLVIILGRAGKDAELAYTPSGAAVCKFSLATSEKWNKDGQKQERTDWHNIIVWGKLAELCNRQIRKGDQIYIEGKLQTSSWEKDGQKFYKTEINAFKVQWFHKKAEKEEKKESTEGAYDI